jgi:hydrogenase-4 component B
MLTLLFKLALAFSPFVFAVPKKWKHLFMVLLHAVLIVSSTSWALDAFRRSEALSIPLNITTWSGSIVLTIDPLSAFFLLVINFICLCGLIYAGGYLKPYQDKKRAVILSAHFFSFLWLHGSMLLVCSVRDGIAFLLAWELMSLFSFILVIFDGQKEHILKTGINYLLQMHLGFALIMLGFLVSAKATGQISFDSLLVYFQQNNNTALFMLFFAGFGIKAGFMPLHTWLPRAHPAAPSHVSAVMSGIMIKMGIYGILRVTSYVHHDWLAIGIWVLVFACLSGIMGVVMAILQHDLKRLLAYHSIENIGIIGIGIAVAIIGKSYGDETLYVLGLAGALLHTLNHALFKSLLFFAAGNVFYATHTVNMDQLGGLVRTMRSSSMIFIVGALAISGIPPLNGFISEFFIYSGIINSISTAGFSLSIVGITAMLSLVIIGGLCVYCFTKAVGLSFLGTRRSENAPVPAEVPFIMIFPAILLITVIVSIGVVPQLYGKILLLILPVFHATLTPQAIDIFAGVLQSIGLVNLVLFGLIGSLLLIRQWRQASVTKAIGPTWGCGYSAGDFRHQYTPTSYAESLRELVQPAIIFKKHYRQLAEDEIFPAPRSFHTESNDLLEQKAILTSVDFVVKLLPKAGVAQTGLINHYLVYPLLFLAILGLLTLLNVL